MTLQRMGIGGRREESTGRGGPQRVGNCSVRYNQGHCMYNPYSRSAGVRVLKNTVR